MDIRREPIDSPTVRALIAALDAELTRMYPEPGATHFRLDAEELGEGRGVFLVAYRDGAAVGCGALRVIAPRTGELKRMYTVPEARGRGIGKRVVAALEREAASLGIERLVLETGVRQAEAIAVYLGAGFEVIEAFGEYVGSPLSVCMGKPLRRA